MRRPPALLPCLALVSSVLLALTIYGAACDSGARASEPSPRGAPVIAVELDERAVIVGEIVERLEAEDYVYLRLSIVEDSAAPEQPAHTRQRWVAVETGAPPLGARIRARSLAHRSRVWEPNLERDFEQLDYVALLPAPREPTERARVRSSKIAVPHHEGR